MSERLPIIYVRGVAYYRDVYHMFFQSNPHSLTSSNDIHR